MSMVCFCAAGDRPLPVSFSFWWWFLDKDVCLRYPGPPRAAAENMNTPTTNLEWALYYRSIGWNPLPPVKGEKRPFGNWTKYQTQRVTEEEIRAWWTADPDANIGTVTGAISGIVVIDVESDGDASGYPPTVTSKTGGGGWHFYYKHPGIHLGNSARKLAPLTDVRGDGGYIILPPSLHKSGNEYAWVVSPEDNELAEFPHHLLTKLTDTKKKPDWRDFSSTAVPEGARNNEAARYIGKLLHDLSPELWETAGWESLRAWNIRTCIPPLGEHELRATFESIARMQTQSRKEWRKDFRPPTVSSKAMTVRMSDVQPVPINWLWPGRIAMGKLTLIAGDPGLGKSLITSFFAAVVSKGYTWPLDGSLAPNGSVVLLSAEDDPGDTIRPRLDAAGADCERIHILKAVQDFDADGKPIQRMFSFKKDIAVLEDLLPTLPDCKLVIIDPISAYLDGTDSHNNTDVRGLLAPIAALASEHKVAVILIQHLNKGNGGGSAMYRSMGSIGFIAAARAAYLVTKDKDNAERRLVMPVKNNLARDTTGLAYSVMDSPNGAPLLVWESEPVLITADEALGRPDSEEQKTNTDWAVEIVEIILSKGPVPAVQVQKEARQAGVSPKMLRRAGEKLGVKPKKTGYSGGWVWSLPEHEDALKVEEAPSENEGALDDKGILA